MATNRYPATGPSRGFRREGQPFKDGPTTRRGKGLRKAPKTPRNPLTNLPKKFGGKPLPATPFGKRVPLPGEVGPARLPKLPGVGRSKLARGLLRGLPLVGAGLTAYELWRWYQTAGSPAVTPADYGFQLCCDWGGPMSLYRHVMINASPGTLLCSGGVACGTDMQVPTQVMAGNQVPTLPINKQQYLYLGPARGVPPNFNSRMRYMQKWHRVATAATGARPAMPFSALKPAVAPQPAPMPYSEFPRFPRGIGLPDDSSGAEPQASPPVRLPPRVRAPRAGEKEAPKRRASRDIAERIRRALGKFLSGASEAGDALDAIYDALPDDVKSKDDKTLADKFWRVYNNAHKVDTRKAMENLVKNDREDRILGPAFGQANENAEDYGFAPWSLKW